MDLLASPASSDLSSMPALRCLKGLSCGHLQQKTPKTVASLEHCQQTCADPTWGDRHLYLSPRCHHGVMHLALTQPGAVAALSLNLVQPFSCP